MNDARVERDSMGEIAVPAGAYWGAQTQRAVENFRISGWRLPPPLIAALGLIKACAAEVNRELGRLHPTPADAVARAAEEVAGGGCNEQFPIDVFQTGSGTSSNMNANEVIANRANEILGSPLGARRPVHPNDHVNLGQSSNDVFPTAIHIAVRGELESLEAALAALQHALEAKAREFADVIKLGRTHLMDAVPMTLGQEFSGYAAQIAAGRQRLRATHAHLQELALGGTAVGTGLNTHPHFADGVIARLAQRTGLPFCPAPNRFEALAARDTLVEAMGALVAVAVSATKIANDLRLLASGPRGGLGEITLPALQPGSSIMPGKVNPVVPEAVMQVGAQVMGCHTAVMIGAQHGLLELNTMMPMMAWNTLTAIGLLERALRLFEERCVRGIRAEVETCARRVEGSLALATPLARRLGYDRAAEIAQRASAEGRTIREIVRDEGALPEGEADELLDPRRMLGPRDE
jgi:fumarate hydratase class II